MDAQATTRDRIVQAAMELFWRKGYGSTSIADILETAKVNSGSLYYFFKGKQELLVAVLEAYRDGIGPMLLEPSWGEVDDPVDKVFALLGTYRRLLVETDCFYGCPIGSLALELHEPDPEVRELLAANFAHSACASDGQPLSLTAPTRCATASSRRGHATGPICRRWPN